MAPGQEQPGVAAAAAGQVEHRRARRHQRREAGDPGGGGPISGMAHGVRHTAASGLAPAADLDHRAGDEARGVGEEPEDRLGDLVRGAHPAERGAPMIGG